jgi:hypothetical protein
MKSEITTWAKYEIHDPKDEDAARAAKGGREALLFGLPLHEDGVPRRRRSRRPWFC